MQLRCPNCASSIESLPAQVAARLACPTCHQDFWIEPAASDHQSTVPTRRRLGRFELLEILGVGGFGTVYRATDPDLERTVAIKVPRGEGLAAGTELDRLLREARSLAQLRHPGIVPVYEVGQEDGVAFLVSEFVQGTTLAERIAAGPIATREAVALVAQVADAVQAAHAHGIIHRDVKPSNVMIDLAGAPRLMDFGLAKRDAAELTMTVDGKLLGTPAYMSPEQAAGEGHSVDGRSDVYSLGVVLYELFTGELPFRGNRRMVIHQVLNVEPVAPRRLNDHVPRDLETICLRAMAKEPARRYASAAELADDLRRYLRGEPIHARPVGAAERLWRWARRNPWLAGLSTAVACLLVVIAVGATIAAWRISEGRNQLADQLRQNWMRRGVEQLEHDDPASGLPWFSKAASYEKDRAHDSARQLLHRLRLSVMLRQFPQLRDTFFHKSNVQFCAFSRDGTRLATADSDGVVMIWDVNRRALVGTALVHPKGVNYVAFDSDGQRLATACSDGQGRVWDVATGKLLATLAGHTGRVHEIVFSPDGRHLVTTSDDRTARVWDAVTGQAIGEPLEHGAVVKHAEFGRDGTFLVTTSLDGITRAWKIVDGANGVPVGPPRQFKSRSHYAALSHDGRRMLTFGGDFSIRLWDVAGATAGAEDAKPILELRPPAGVAQYAALSPRGDWIVTGDDKGNICLWDARKGQLQTTIAAHRGRVNYIEFSADGQLFLTASNDGTVRIWDKGAKPTTPLLHHAAGVNYGRFSPNGHFVATASRDQSARLLDIQTIRLLKSGPSTWGVVLAAANSADGPRVITSAPATGVVVRNATDGRVLSAANVSAKDAANAWLSEDGALCLVTTRDGKARVWNAEQRAEQATATTTIDLLLTEAVTITWVAFSPDGRLVVAADKSGAVTVANVSGGRQVTRLAGHSGAITHVVFSPNGKFLATASDDKTASIWEAGRGETEGQWQRVAVLSHAASIREVAFSPDSRLVVTASRDATAQVWEVASGKPVGQPLIHERLVWTARFSPDGRRVVTGSADKTARVWDTFTGEPVTPPLGHGGEVMHVAFDPSDPSDPRGSIVLTAAGDKTARLWDASTGEPVSLHLPHSSAVSHLRISPDGRSLLTVSTDAKVYLWDLSPDERPLDDLVIEATLMAAQKIDASQALVPLRPAEVQELWELRELWKQHQARPKGH